MNERRMIAGTLVGLLFLTACGPGPAAEMVGDGTPSSEAVALGEMPMAGESQPGGSDIADEKEADIGNAGHDADKAADSTDESEMADNTAPMDDGQTASGERPAWQQISLTDAHTGEQFSLAGYSDKVVFVEPFATWCSNCRRQLGHVQTAYTALAGDAVFVALSVEPNIAEEELVNYAEKQGFSYTFAAMPPEMLRELSSIFGQTIANPPATPHFMIRPDGSTTELVTGFEEPEVLIERIRAAAR